MTQPRSLCEVNPTHFIYMDAVLSSIFAEYFTVTLKTVCEYD